VFAAPNGRRRRRVRATAMVLSGLVSLWLAALVAGMLGFGGLPALPVPSAPGAQRDAVVPTVTPLSDSPAARRASRSALGSSSSPRSTGSASAGQSPAPVRRVARRRSDSTGPTSSHVSAPVATTRPGRGVGQSSVGEATGTGSVPPGQAKKAVAPTLEHGRVGAGGPKAKL
jgi:hypothetical protein